MNNKSLSLPTLKTNASGLGLGAVAGATVFSRLGHGAYTRQGKVGEGVVVADAGSVQNVTLDRIASAVAGASKLGQSNQARNTHIDESAVRAAKQYAAQLKHVGPLVKPAVREGARVRPRRLAGIQRPELAPFGNSHVEWPKAWRRQDGHTRSSARALALSVRADSGSSGGVTANPPRIERRSSKATLSLRRSSLNIPPRRHRHRRRNLQKRTTSQSSTLYMDESIAAMSHVTNKHNHLRAQNDDLGGWIFPCFACSTKTWRLAYRKSRTATMHWPIYLCSNCMRLPQYRMHFSRARGSTTSATAGDGGEVEGVTRNTTVKEDGRRLQRGPQSRSGFLDDIIKVLKPEEKAADEEVSAGSGRDRDARSLLDRTLDRPTIPSDPDLCHGEEAKKAYEKVSKSKRNFFAEDHRVETSVAASPPRRTLKRSLSMNDALTKHGPHAVSEIT